MELYNNNYEIAGAYGRKVSTQKSNIMMNSTTSADITMNDGKLEVNSFESLGATLSKHTNISEVRIRIAMATAAMARLSR
ncbi:hypothetical protein DPMN_052057 [Dreissena polymorpha]|uniref:Uncharacterized protein n=1 Tax=Dreissena polymorpha TaxID=45954 RepID=A0A9D4CKZ7_DREPO|nr:hypothetical protein DPMN_052057 [Dreissena polymorpha]